ncbi:hypothetical protein PPYR_02479, partial [Photinus pyralis]
LSNLGFHNVHGKGGTYKAKGSSDKQDEKPHAQPTADDLDLANVLRTKRRKITLLSGGNLSHNIGKCASKLINR